MFKVEGKYSTAKVYANELEKGAITQIRNLCNQIFTEGSSISLMPDAHTGIGCVIGATMTIKDKIVPNLVGVDISCGVEAINIGNNDFDPAKLDAVIHERIPAGFAIRKDRHPLAQNINLENLTCACELALTKGAKSIGTLGGGNHFIEIDRDENGDYWLVIHTGSRNLGLQVASHHQEIARKINPKAPVDLAWLEGEAFNNYIHDMKIMQIFANLNRQAISEEIIDGMGWIEKDRFTTVHNYLDTETMILRKGAVSAKAGEKLLVPINMRDGTLLCKGLGNAEWNFSAPHGAGRLLSRGEAKRKLSLDDYKSQMKDIYTTSVNEETLDEAPGAYKPMKDIMEAIADTARIISVLKPVYNFKASKACRKRRRKRY